MALHHPFLTEEGRKLDEIVEKFEHRRAVDWRDPHVVDFCITSAILYHCTAGADVGVPYFFIIVFLFLTKLNKSKVQDGVRKRI